MSFSQEQTKSFSEAAQSLKLYRRADLIDEQSGRGLIDDLYIDPLPHDAVITAILKANTTFLIGRKGTGKSTIFQRAQAILRQKNGVASAYLDIKTIFEGSQVDTAVLERFPTDVGLMPRTEIEKLLLYRGFLFSLLAGICDELKRKLKESLWEKVKETFTGTLDELFEDLDHLLQDSHSDKFISVIGAKRVSGQDKRTQTEQASNSVGIGIDKDGPSGSLKVSDEFQTSDEAQRDFNDLVMRSFNLKEILTALKELLNKASIRHLYVFIDDFSELPEEAMRLVVDALLAPLNNWSEEFIKFKIAAYPNRIYHGQIDKTKVDEFYLDIFQLYGTGDISTMETKAADFVKRLASSRIQHFCKCEPSLFLESDDAEMWRTLFFASAGNPRTLGYLLFFLYESTLIYGRKIGLKAIRDAAKRFYEEKLESYFQINKFLHESYTERSSVYSLKELLEKTVIRARELRSHKDSQVMREIGGRPPTSHFHVIREFENVFGTLELNFFVTKYFEMTDRDGHRVVVFALNYGLCQKYAIEFGRPVGKREFRLYFVERIFDYSSIVKAHIEANQEIVCDQCLAYFGMEQLEPLKLYGMLCPKCRRGTCRVTNLSRKYEKTLKEINESLLLPSTELGILKTLHAEKRPLYAADIATELDCSHQLVGRRGKNLADRKLVKRDYSNQNRRQFTITEQAEKSYFTGQSSAPLEVGPDADENLHKDESKPTDLTQQPASTAEEGSKNA
jgi:hypothetical protein